MSNSTASCQLWTLWTQLFNIHVLRCRVVDRFVAAHARGVAEIDMFAYGASSNADWTEQWWDLSRRYLQCGKSIPEGQCWPQ